MYLENNLNVLVMWEVEMFKPSNQDGHNYWSGVPAGLWEPKIMALNFFTENVAQK